MRRPRRVAGPLVAAMLAAAAAFTIVVLATGSGAAEPAAPAPSPDPAPAAVTGHGAGRAVFAGMGCGSCHRLSAAGSAGEIGPDLDERLEYHTRASLTARILDPSQGLGEGFSVMPDDFGSRMSDDELAALVDFLLAARRAR